jgi:DNA-binding MarR family transcriptional regulator
MTTRIEQDTELASRLRLAVTRLARRLRQQAPEGISPSQLSALVALEGAGSMTLKELATVERVRPPTMTRVVAALEESGLVARSIDPKDRRCIHLELTSAGRTLISRTRGRKTAYLAERVGELSATDRAALGEAMRILEHFVDERD